MPSDVVSRLELPTVTLCAATSTNVDATVAAIASSSEQIVFGDVLLLTDSESVESLPCGRIERIAPLRSACDYSQFMLGQLADHVRTDHCLVIQWDGFVIDPQQWKAGRKSRPRAFRHVQLSVAKLAGQHRVGRR